MDAGNEENEAGTEAPAPSWATRSRQAGWGAPAGSSGGPAPTARRRPVFRGTGPARWQRPEAEEDGGGAAWPSEADAPEEDASWQGGRMGHDEATAAMPAIGPDDLDAEDLGTYEIDHDELDAYDDAGPYDHDDAAPYDAARYGLEPYDEGELEDGADLPEPAYGRDLSFAPLDDYDDGTGLAGPVGSPEVWGASSYQDAASDPSFRPADPSGSRRYPPVFPGDARFRPPRPRRRRGGVALTAALALLVLVAAGVIAAVTLHGPSPARSSSNATTTLPATQPAKGTTGAAAPTAKAPTTTVPLSPLGSWKAKQLHVILHIKSDLTSLNGHLVAQPDFSLLTDDATSLGQDLRAARRAPAPPDPTVAGAWTQMLEDLQTSNDDLNRAIDARDPSLAQDLSATITNTDSDYNTLSNDLNEQLGQAAGTPSS